MPGRVRHVLTIGQDGPRIAAVASACGVEQQACTSLEAAVAVAHTLGIAGDTVLLSPACASLDMFDNYMQRGDHFAAAVEQLAIGATNAPAQEGQD